MCWASSVPWKAWGASGSSAQIVEKAAAQRTALVLHLMLGVEGDHALARFAHIAEEQLEQKALALSAVAKDEHIAVRLVGRTAK